MTRTNDMTPPGTTHGVPVPIRTVRRDMVHKIANDEKVGLLDLDSWLMARSFAEKKALLEGRSTDDPGTLVVAWCGGRWTDFFEFGDDGCYQAVLSALTPRRSVMLTEEEVAAVQAYREGSLTRPTGKRTARKT